MPKSVQIIRSSTCMPQAHGQGQLDLAAQAWILFPWALLSINAQSLVSFLPLPFSLKGYWLFLLAFSFSFFFFATFFRKLFSFSLLFLASRIIFMIFQILSNMSPFSSFFQEPTFMNHKFKRHMHCLSIHSENKSIATTSK